MKCVCNHKKLFPKDWITINGTDIHSDFLKYINPLIEGELDKK